MGGGLQDFSVGPSPLSGLFGLELGWTGLGLGLVDSLYQYPQNTLLH